MDQFFIFYCWAFAWVPFYINQYSASQPINFTVWWIFLILNNNKLFMEPNTKALFRHNHELIACILQTLFQG